jgi:glycosyltransferase involved in cell wall biosynthesis
MTYTLKDISVIIPTIDRPKEIVETLKHIPDTIKEIIIVNQGCKLNLTRVNKSIPIKIVHSEPPSITIARNKGLQFAGGKLICYLDDDITISEYYFEHILEVFNKFPDVEGVAGWRPYIMTMKMAFTDIFKSIFGLRQFGPPRIYTPYGNSYPFHLWGAIYAEWLPGMNMVFKREVFTKKSMRFDENLLGYTIAEDIDFTYSIFKRNPKGLIITPYAPIKHRDAQGNRASSEEQIRRLAYINQIDHLYFAYKHNMLDAWGWNVFCLSFLRLCAVLTCKEEHYFKYCYFLESLWYCLTHTNEIKNGRLREWEK